MTEANQPWLSKDDDRLIQFIDSHLDWRPKVAKQNWQEIALVLKRTPLATKSRAGGP